mgnify:FL=1
MRVGDEGTERGREAPGADGATDWEIRVLHVDDDPALLDVTDQFLQQEDERIAVETAPPPQQGLASIDDGGVTAGLVVAIPTE